MLNDWRRAVNGVHDMGGMHGFGPIDREAHESAEWVARVMALQNLTMRQEIFNLDEFRYGIEQMAPAQYLRASYFERWLATLEYNLIKHGVLSRDELDSRIAHFRQHPDVDLPQPTSVVHPQPAPRTPSEPTVPTILPRFAVGDRVVTRNEHPAHHTRLPRYARGKRGVINMVHGPEVFADTNAHGLGENPQVVYNVRFDAHELWGNSAEPRQTVAIDLWESYLEEASDE
jgi:nitrile hydratase